MSKNKQRIELLIIDPQNDFCNDKGALFVPGADKDSGRLGNMIHRLKDQIDDIHVTLDSHHLLDIAHPLFWIDSNGKHPGPFTLISEDDVMNGKWKPVNPGWTKRAEDYVKGLKANNRYMLCVWPPHCLIGTWGHNVVDPIMKSLLEWESDVRVIDFVTKGSNPWTEHYSAVQADVPDPADPSTLLNKKLIDTLTGADIIGITGQALSHCVANTVTDIANKFGDKNIEKMYLLEDTTSNVTSFEKFGEDFVKNMVARGMKTVKSTDFLV